MLINPISNYNYDKNPECKLFNEIQSNFSIPNSLGPNKFLISWKNLIFIFVLIIHILMYNRIKMSFTNSQIKRHVVFFSLAFLFYTLSCSHIKKCEIIERA